jgi:hypothetical protein
MVRARERADQDVIRAMTEAGVKGMQCRFAHVVVLVFRQPLEKRCLPDDAGRLGGIGSQMPFRVRGCACDGRTCGSKPRKRDQRVPGGMPGATQTLMPTGPRGLGRHRRFQQPRELGLDARLGGAARAAGEVDRRERDVRVGIVQGGLCVRAITCPRIRLQPGVNRRNSHVGGGVVSGGGEDARRPRGRCGHARGNNEMAANLVVRIVGHRSRKGPVDRSGLHERRHRQPSNLRRSVSFQCFASAFVACELCQAFSRSPAEKFQLSAAPHERVEAVGDAGKRIGWNVGARRALSQGHEQFLGPLDFGRAAIRKATQCAAEDASDERIGLLADSSGERLKRRVVLAADHGLTERIGRLGPNVRVGSG